jgi:hypothetical protein
VTVIPAAGGTFDGTTSGPSTLAGACGASAASPERVFQWTPARSGIARIDTCGTRTKFSTVVYLRRTNCQRGSEIACNQGACGASGPARGSRISPTVVAGETYFIVVDGEAGASGAFRLHVSDP